MNYRDWLQKIIYKIINPLVNGMIKVGITPNIITTIGFLLNIVAAGILVYASLYADACAYSCLGWAGGIILFAGLFDMMDGRVARMGNMSSTFGAFYDSVLDRYSELFTLFGITYFLFMNSYPIYSVISFFALIGSLMVSYVRARAEGLGIECKVGFMQRPERVVLTSLGALFCGIFSDTTAFDPILILMVPLTLVAVLANVTAFVRVKHCYVVMKMNERNKKNEEISD
ncbi:MAG: CDP-alcohol phosphatidyltransferase family protein [Bacteroidaceae bacterium]|nr:CDP-alcohol phosphatidyltransferase family protein [Bacteroidaceae bacterium]